MGANRRVLWLGAVLIVAIIAAIVVRSGDDARPRAAGPARAASSRGNAEAQTPLPPADVDLAALAESREPPVDLGRNPFRFQARRAVTSPPQTLAGAPDDQVDAPAPLTPAGPSGPPAPPPIPLKLIGIVQKADGTKIAVLSDGKRPISGAEGEEIEGRYKILKIGTESVEIAYIDGRGRRTIPLNGQ